MPFIPVPNVVQLEAVYSMDGQTVENVYHYQMPAAVDATLMLDFAAAWVVEWIANQKAYIPTEVSLINVKVTDLTTAVSPVVNYSSGMPIAGTQTGALLPNNCTLCFTKRTALRGRSNRGRLYWPGLGEPNVTNNTVGSALVASIITGLNNMRTVVSPLGNWEMVVVSRFHEKVARPSGIFTPVTNFTSDGKVDSQRRRLPGRGK